MRRARSTHVDVFLETQSRARPNPGTERHRSTFHDSRRREQHLRRQDGALSPALGDVLVLQRLRRRQPVVLVEPAHTRVSTRAHTQQARRRSQHPLVDRVVPATHNNNAVSTHARRPPPAHATHSLLRDITMRMPPRATSRKRMWNPRNSFPARASAHAAHGTRRTHRSR